MRWTGEGQDRGHETYLAGAGAIVRAQLRRILDQGIEAALIGPGKPWQNGTSESFNDKFRDECLSLEWFRSRAGAPWDRVLRALGRRITAPLGASEDAIKASRLKLSVVRTIRTGQRRFNGFGG